jgi:hypothetical protein
MRVAAAAFVFAASPAFAQDSHPIHVTADLPVGVVVETGPRELRFASPAPGRPYERRSSASTAAVSYTAGGNTGLAVQIDRDTRLDGVVIEARPVSSRCGVARTVDLDAAPQVLVDLSGAPACAERLLVEYVARIDDERAFRPAHGDVLTTVTFTLF